MAVTLTEPSDDQKQIDVYNRKMRAGNVLDITPGDKYALCLLKLNAGVVPSDYGTLGTNIKAVTGVQDIDLVVDNQNAGGTVTTTGTVPAGKKLVAVVDIHLRIEDDNP